MKRTRYAIDKFSIYRDNDIAILTGKIIYVNDEHNRKYDDFKERFSFKHGGDARYYSGEAQSEMSSFIKESRQWEMKSMTFQVVDNKTYESISEFTIPKKDLDEFLLSPILYLSNRR